MKKEQLHITLEHLTSSINALSDKVSLLEVGLADMSARLVEKANYGKNRAE